MNNELTKYLFLHVVLQWFQTRQLFAHYLYYFMNTVLWHMRTIRTWRLSSFDMAFRDRGKWGRKSTICYSILYI